MQDTRRGFSLVELMIVVAIILILVGITVPNFIRSKIAANEASAQQSLEVLNDACFSFWTMYDVYPSALSDLLTADLITSDLAGGVKNGFTFAYTSGSLGAKQDFLSYTIVAKPLVPGITGLNTYSTSQTGVVRESLGDGSTAVGTSLVELQN